MCLREGKEGLLTKVLRSVLPGSAWVFGARLCVCAHCMTCATWTGTWGRRSPRLESGAFCSKGESSGDRRASHRPLFLGTKRSPGFLKDIIIKALDKQTVIFN